ncbi:hypothetical protein [Castellaniella sp.]|uniref:hypothetical protein n=1 Tax=Castellaniella sp. TaxID=1955812 RepID=UPI002AFF26B3|nr:hypothetical protein [Castellaniella sp.]
MNIQQALDIRIDYAIAKVNHWSSLGLFALKEANEFGYVNYSSPVPNLFIDEPDLKQAFLGGQRSAALEIAEQAYNDAIDWVEELAEMNACSGCNNLHGHPCPHHG